MFTSMTVYKRKLRLVRTCLGFGGDPFLNSKIVLVGALPNIITVSFVPWGWVRGLARH